MPVEFDQPAASNVRCLTAATIPSTQSQVLRQRADHLRLSAVGMHDLVAQAYRRRAAELEFEAWLTDLNRVGQGAAA